MTRLFLSWVVEFLFAYLKSVLTSIFMKIVYFLCMFTSTKKHANAMLFIYGEICIDHYDLKTASLLQKDGDIYLYEIRIHWWIR